MILVLIISIGMALWLRKKAFVKYAVGAIVLTALTTFLFKANGTLASPSGDGVITQVIRRHFNDGPQVAILGLMVIFFTYGGVIYLLRKGYKKTKES